MEKYRNLDAMISYIVTCCELFVGRKEPYRYPNLQGIGEIAKDIFSKSESIPEFLFSQDLLELLSQLHIEVFNGDLTDEELKDVEKQIHDETNEPFLEMFINPDFLFENGKIRPDVVFRKGAGNYLIFEIDSFQFHSNQHQLIKDKQRERKIESLGHPVFRFAAKEVLHGNSWNTAIEAVKILGKKGFAKVPEETKI